MLNVCFVCLGILNFVNDRGIIEITKVDNSVIDVLKKAAITIFIIGKAKVRDLLSHPQSRESRWLSGLRSEEVVN